MKRWRWCVLGVTAACVTIAFVLTRPANSVVAAAKGAAAAKGLIARCGTPDVDEKTMAAIRKRLAAAGPAAADGTLTIPVQFIHITDGADGVITQQQRDDQIDVLNAAYGSFGVEFVSAGPPIVHDDASWFNMAMGTASEVDAKTALHVDPNTNLNFYTCVPMDGSDVLLGFATFPWDLASKPALDGVAIHWQSLPGGDFAPYDLGQTATHEIGHWLGLFHTFQGGCFDPNNDEVADTVAHSDPNFGCPPPGRNGACNAAEQAPIHNFMNYTDDACMFEFTAGQAARWQDIVGTYRPDLGGGGDCALTRLAGKISAPALLPLDSLRVMRDNLFRNSADGRRLARLYYDHSSELFRVMLKDPVLARRSINAILAALPKDRGASGQVVMSAELYDECLILMERLETKSSDELTNALADVRAILERRAEVAGTAVILRFPADQPQVAAASAP